MGRREELIQETQRTKAGGDGPFGDRDILRHRNVLAERQALALEGIEDLLRSRPSTSEEIRLGWIAVHNAMREVMSTPTRYDGDHIFRVFPVKEDESSVFVVAPALNVRIKVCSVDGTSLGDVGDAAIKIANCLNKFWGAR